jgi:hypothetical protein
MSYSADINFKTVKEGELYAFLKQIKDTCKENFDEIAKDNFIFMPSVSSTKKRLLEGASDRAKEEVDRAWMRNSVFSYRFFYIPEHNLLGVFGVPTKVDEIFDLTCYFQNSCDQDYPFTDWNGIPIFEEIANKWKNATDGEVIEYYHNRYGDVYDEEENSDLEYYRRSFTYDEIWKMCEKYLYHEEEVVYISMFGFYEIAEQIGFVHKCREAYEEWNKRFGKGATDERN